MFKMMYSRECLYDVEWQGIRVSMLGTWDTPQAVKHNIRTLRQYCDPAIAQFAHGDLYERYTRCTNYFAAILLGYGSKEMFAEHKELVKEAHTQFSAAAPKFQSFKEWDWSKVERDLKTASSSFLRDCNDNLKKRIYTSTKRTGGTQHRPELMKFVGILQQEMKSRA